MMLRSMLSALLLGSASLATAQGVQLDTIPPTAEPAPAPVQATPAPTPTPVPQGKVALESLQIVRKRSFTETNAPQPNVLTTSDADSIRRQLLLSGMMFEFRVTPPPGYDLISVDSASVEELTDSTGAPIGRVTLQGAGAAGTIDSLSTADTAELNTEFATVNLRTPLPGRGESQLRTLKAAFKVQLGERNTIHVHDLRGKLNTELLPSAASGLSVMVTEIGTDRITVAASGPLDEIGNLEIVDLDKRELRDLGREQNTLRENNVERHLFTYHYDHVPQFVGINIDIYPRVETQTIVQQWQNVELP